MCFKRKLLTSCTSEGRAGAVLEWGCWRKQNPSFSERCELKLTGGPHFTPLAWNHLGSWDLGDAERLKGPSLDFGTSCPPLTPLCTFPGLNQAQPWQHPAPPSILCHLLLPSVIWI